MRQEARAERSGTLRHGLFKSRMLIRSDLGAQLGGHDECLEQQHSTAENTIYNVEHAYQSEVGHVCSDARAL